jgi:NADPH:quinone reductase-like Zn-dependent oxidoreductase
MRAVELRNDFGIENLNLVERAAEGAPGPGQVKLRMRAASLNYRDLFTVKNGAMSGVKLPAVPCSDGAGEVVAVGAGVTRLNVGDKVTPLFFQSWQGGPPSAEKLSQPLGTPLDGCLRDEMVLSEAGVVKAPSYMSFEEAATLPCAALTAWSTLVTEGHTKPGDVVLVQGTGGVSLFALQFAKALGASVIATSSSDEKLERARALGADHLINYRTTEDWASEARRVTGGRGVDTVVEVGGAGTFEQSLRAVRIGGLIGVIGILSGFANTINVASIMGQHLKVQGITVGSRDAHEDMVRALETHRIKPVIDKTFPLAGAADAFRLMESASHFGKIVVTH